MKLKSTIFKTVALLVCTIFLTSLLGTTTAMAADTDYGLIFNVADGKFYLDRNFDGEVDAGDTEYTTGQGTTWSWNAATTTLSLNNFTWTTPTERALTIVNGSLTINITETNTFTSTHKGESEANGIFLWDSHLLTITGSGILNATGGTSMSTNYACSGIFANGGITVTGGTVIANGGGCSNGFNDTSQSTGIWGDVTVNGGTVIAAGYSTEANGLSYGIFGHVIVTAGTVTATSGWATTYSGGIAGNATVRCYAGKLQRITL
jgi:hypothetical protein